MASLWDSLRASVVDTGNRLGNAAGSAALKAKLKADLLLIDRELLARKQKFGVEMYDYVAPLSKNQSFYTSDDTLTVTLQPPLITAQREISALEIKRAKQQELIQKAAQVRATAFRPAETWTDKLANVGKSAALGGNEAKLSTEMAIYKGQILHFKQEFGVQLYTTLEELEDSKQWLPTDREIRSIYDNCRRDIEKIQKRRQAKDKEIEAVDNGGVEAYASPVTESPQNPSMSIQTEGAQPSIYAKQNVVNTPQGFANPQPVMYPVVQQVQQQQREPQASMQQPQPAIRQEHVPPPQMQQPPEPQMALHNNMFAGVVPGSVPIAPAPAPQQQQQPVDPFAVFDTATTTQPQSDPFANQFQPAPPMQNPGASTAPQQPQQNDPFANQFQPPPLQAPAPAAYADPFAGL